MDNREIGKTVVTPACFIGVDLGTSGCRALAIDESGVELASSRTPIPPPEMPEPGHVHQDPQLWWSAVVKVLQDLTAQLPDHRPRRLSIDATSATLLLTTADGTPTGNALTYNDSRSTREAERIAQVAATGSAATGSTSSLAKLLYLALEQAHKGPLIATHQADWVSTRLTGIAGISDYNNCLKLGYDPGEQRWPPWLGQLDLGQIQLPRVCSPGTPIGPIASRIATLTGLPEDLQITTGTTDSTAAVIAAGARFPGDAVTCLGSTLVLKIVSRKRIDAPELGIYSHRYGDNWLVGGASNSGGAVLRSYFTDARIRELSTRLMPDRPTNLDYYPLPAPGERFPIRDPSLPPRLQPRPRDDGRFLQGILEGIARIEANGFQRLRELGAPEVSSITTIGGGASNNAWTRIRSRILVRPVAIAPHQEAAYGSALIALRQGIA